MGIQLIGKESFLHWADHVRLWLFCLVLPTLFALAAMAFDVPVAGGGYETSAYATISIDWLENGHIEGHGSQADQYYAW